MYPIVPCNNTGHMNENINQNNANHSNFQSKFQYPPHKKRKISMSMSTIYNASPSVLPSQSKQGSSSETYDEITELLGPNTETQDVLTQLFEEETKQIFIFTSIPEQVTRYMIDFLPQTEIFRLQIINKTFKKLCQNIINKSDFYYKWLYSHPVFYQMFDPLNIDKSDFKIDHSLQKEYRIKPKPVEDISSDKNITIKQFLLGLDRSIFILARYFNMKLNIFGVHSKYEDVCREELNDICLYFADELDVYPYEWFCVSWKDAAGYTTFRVNAAGYIIDKIKILCPSSVWRKDFMTMKVNGFEDLKKVRHEMNNEN